MFRHWPFTNSLLLISVLSVGLFAVLFYIPLFLQQAHGPRRLRDRPAPAAAGAGHGGAACRSPGRLYDKIGPRWPAVIGLSIVAWGTYELHVLTLDTSHEHLIWLLALRAVGMGIAMMPIMTGGIAAVPPAQVSRASAFNNVVQRTSAALGLAVLTAMVDRSQAQFAADRAALLGPGTDLPALGSGPTGQLAGMYATYQQLQTQVFVEAMDGLFIVTAVITAVGIGLAFLLRSGPAPKAPGGAGACRDVIASTAPSTYHGPLLAAL